MAESQSQKLTASYTSPDNQPFTVSEPLPAISTPGSVEEKTKFLNSLREGITSAQDQINKELTQRMEEDKARLASSNGASKVDDAKEEENYGEEVAEEED